MRALVVYESMFGNTKRVAEAIGRGLSTHVVTEVVEVGAAPETITEDVDLVVVGGPTHAFGLSSPRTRDAAAAQSTTPVVSQDKGVREWAACLHPHADRLLVATFDTHVDKEWLPGAASKRLEKMLRSMGMRSIAAPTSFYVHDTSGPLLGGEIERAELLGRRLGEELLSRHPSLA
ncbi:MAG TPA: flavodoxin domain-containing protein [Actinomycetales bacterium]|nr:flavodoxin domain-containing protein [Actinomycetales bacterium]